jgi:UDP-N-acetylglucosamine 4,6-dehydratase/5-epimerase
VITGGTGSFGNAVLINAASSDDRPRARSASSAATRRSRTTCASATRATKLRSTSATSATAEPAGGRSMRGVDYVFHAAALKQVPSCEFHPMEAVKTNVLGTENVLEAAIECGVRVVCLSTDKAVYPINAMGISKAMMEKVMVAKSRNLGRRHVICGTRYGNVMASRGSVIPLFVEQIRAASPHPHRPGDDALHDDARRRRRPGALRLRARQPATSSCRRRRPPRSGAGRALLELMGRPDHPVASSARATARSSTRRC